ncbi:MAG TPA: hypothetical protein VFE17_06535 [Candidatus Baltobacteraceae bacterium]|nr:hypothetical protein [Candidatus Baltobacteraceae bacterium]
MLFSKKKQPNEAPAPAAFDVVYALEGRRGERSAQATDLSAGGLRLCCDEDLIAGCTISLDFTLPDEFLSTMTVDSYIHEDTPLGSARQRVQIRPPAFAPVSVRAKVLTNFFDRTTGAFAHGVAFLEVDRHTTEELERFIGLWQRAYGNGRGTAD